MSTPGCSSRTYTKDTLTSGAYHHGVDDDIILDVWKSYLREWSKNSNNNRRISICKPAQMLASAHSLPNELRSEIWFVISGGKQLMNKYSNNPERNYKYLSHREDTLYIDQINKDFERTFVTKDLPIIRQKIQHQLRRMLIGYANYNEDIGYAQGMNMICAFVLRQFLQHDEFFNTNYNQYDQSIYNKETNYDDISSSFTINADIPDTSSTYNSYNRSSHSSLVLECGDNEAIIEEQAFWCFVCIMTNIDTLFQRKLIGYHKSVECLMNVLKIHDNELWKHFDKMGIDTLFTGVFLKWFTSLFSYPSFNLNSTQKIWDLWLFYQFDFGVFIKFAFLIFENHKEELMNMDEIDIPQFCVSSQCIVTEKNWMLRLSKIKMKPFYLGNNRNNNYNHNNNDNHDDEKKDDNDEPMEICLLRINRLRSERSYGEYQVDIKCIDNTTWSVWKRYSEFARLCNKLKLLGIESDDGAIFPSKSWLFKSNNSSLMKSRKNILNEYLKNILKKYNKINKKTNKTDGTLRILHDFVNYFAIHTVI